MHRHLLAPALRLGLVALRVSRLAFGATMAQVTRAFDILSGGIFMLNNSHGRL